MKVMVTAVLATMLCAPVYATEVAPANPAPVKAENLFTKADKNNDGKLDKNEFSAFKQLQEERRSCKSNNAWIKCNFLLLIKMRIMGSRRMN